jgi:alpha-glucosidase
MQSATLCGSIFASSSRRLLSLSLLLLLFLVTAVLVARADDEPATSTTNNVQVQNIDEVEWWKKTNFYHIYLRSFKDSNGDGNGDLRGVIQKLDYLKQIGVETILMAPFYSSPMKDCGYDIDNYEEINPMFGTMQDFDELMSELKKRNMRMVVDFVPNHSSNKHYWFWCSERAFVKEHVDECSKYMDYYVWTNSRRYNNSYPTNWVSVFGGGPAWTWSELRQQFYLHQFLPEQPDLNFKNPAVREEFKKIARFWLRKGADGLRVDSAIYLIEDTDNWPDNPPNPNWRPGDDPFDKQLHTYTRSLPESAEIVRDWRQIGMEPEFAGQQKVVITEAYEDDLNLLVEYYGRSPNDKFADLPFNFELLKLNQANMNSQRIEQLAMNWIVPTRNLRWPDEHGAMSPWIIWVTGNHDTKRALNRVGEHNLIMLRWLSYFLPGVPVNYYGDELPISDANFNDIPARTIAEGEPTRLPFRVPMAWTPETPSGGFSSSPTIWMPLNRNYQTNNVESLLSNSSDPFNHLKLFLQLQALRRERLPTFVFGDCVFFRNQPEEVDMLLAVGRVHERFGNLLLLANLDADDELVVRLRAGFSAVRRKPIAAPTSGTVLLTNLEDLARAPKVQRGARLDELEGLVLARSQVVVLSY